MTSRRRIATWLAVFVGGVLLLAVILWITHDSLRRIDYTSFPRRAAWQRPVDVIAALEIRDGDQVADIGAGDGYFERYLSEAVGPSGKVFAIDIDEAKLDRLRERIRENAWTNVQAVVGQPEDPMLPDGQIDLVLIVNTYHHIEERTQYFSDLRTDLAPNARVAVVEPDADLKGILRLATPSGHATARVDLLAEMAEAGYQHVESHTFLPVQLIEVFQPVGPEE